VSHSTNTVILKKKFEKKVIFLWKPETSVYIEGLPNRAPSVFLTDAVKPTDKSTRIVEISLLG
jgi:hypothetical protein